MTLRITSTPNAPDLQAEEQMVVSSLAQLGVTVTESDGPDLALTLAQGAFDLAIDTQSAGPFLSDDAASYLTGAPANVSRSSNPNVDALIGQIDTIFDGQRRRALVNQVDQALWADYQSLPLFQIPAVLASRSKYLNLAASASIEGPTWDVEKWGVATSS